MYTLKVEGAFEAAHHVNGYPGKCARLHGHNWVVEAVVKGKELDELARRCRECREPARKQRLKSELREKLRSDFNQRLRDSRRDLETNRERLARLEVELTRREKNRDTIVEALLNQRLNGQTPPPPPPRRK